VKHLTLIALLLLSGCSAMQTALDVLDAPTTLRCSSLQENSNGTFCGGQRCAGSGTCDGDGCECSSG
jgi:hypothetical protein